MPIHLVKNGWKFLRGHKAKGGHIITKPKMFSQTKTMHLAATEVSIPGMRKFAGEQWILLNKQLIDAEKEQFAIKHKIEQLVILRAQWQTIVEAYKGILNEK